MESLHNKIIKHRILFILTDIVEARQIKITSNNEDAVRIIASQLKSGASLSVTVEGGPTASIQITRGMRFTKMRGMRSDSTVYMSEDHHLWCSLGGQRPNNLRCYFLRQDGVEQCKGMLFLPHIMSKLVTDISTLPVWILLPQKDEIFPIVIRKYTAYRIYGPGFCPTKIDHKCDLEAPSMLGCVITWKVAWKNELIQ